MRTSLGPMIDHGSSSAHVSAPSADLASSEADVRAWIRLLALREESYHAARQHVLDVFEEEYLDWLMRRTAGNRSKAARIAGITRRTVYRLVSRYSDDPPDPSLPTPQPGPGGFGPSLPEASAYAVGKITR